MFSRKFEATFLAIFPRMNFTSKTLLSPLIRIQHSYGKRMFAIVKRPKYLYHHQKPPATDHSSPSATAATHHHPLSPSQLVATTSIKDIFENLSNILGNLIYILNTPKISYLKKLFLKIAFRRILFPIIKIYFIYQIPPKSI